VRVLDPDDAALDALDLIAPVAELENVAGEAFDGKSSFTVPMKWFSGSSNTW
jgi:hypothetical protein